MKGIAILGSTGSIGVSTLDVVAAFPDDFKVYALAAGRNIELLAEQVRKFRPKVVSVAEEQYIAPLKDALGADAQGLEITFGHEGTIAVVSHQDVSFVMTAMVGAIGLRPTLAAIRRGIEVGIANKEPLVAAGALCTSEARKHGATLIPVDSEHNAIYQSLVGHRREDVQRILLTCSGGPFRTVQDLSQVTRAQALKHPTWTMGQKITIDSATLMNKGLEVIEARWLFDMPADKIKILIHPQSVIHSMVEYVDGSVIAQLGTPDMRVPIGYALGYPGRLPLPIPKLDFAKVAQLTFEEPDLERFRCGWLAYHALELGGTAPVVLNAANEIAVDAFLKDKIRFIEIPQTIEKTLEAHELGSADDLEQIVAADGWARTHAQTLIGG